MADPAAALKAQLKRLAEQRAALEAQIAQRSARLEMAGVGMSAPLVDREVCASAYAGCGQHAWVHALRSEYVAG